MQVLANRSGVAVVIGSSIISLGWNVWGWDGGKRYIMWHLWRPRLFIKL